VCVYVCVCLRVCVCVLLACARSDIVMSWLVCDGMLYFNSSPHSH
jgi:hypothetical protein